jgi:precorrin-2 dehydrogenase/sirohydrochlorin ferrochelatase
LLIGGGLVASGRLYYLLEASAHVTLISPRERLHPETAYRIDVSNSDDITYHDRAYSGASDEIKVTDYDMIMTAIDDVALSKEVCGLCRDAKLPVNVADVPPECDFYFGSQLRRGPLQIMVSTGGKGPKLASMIRKQIEAGLPDDIEAAIEAVGALRGELRKRAPGTGGPLGQKRMEWMIGICDRWPLHSLGQMDPETRKWLLDEGWDKERILGPEDSKNRSVQPGWTDKLGAVVTPTTAHALGGFTAGLTLAAVAFGVWSRTRQ